MATEPLPPGVLVAHALRAVREGLGANAWLRALTEAGAGVRRQVGLRVYAQAKRLNAEYGEEITRPLNAVPVQSETAPWEVQGEGGVLQTVLLFYREAVTGRTVERFYNVKTAEGVTRQEAVNRAIDANTANATRYQQSLTGAFHIGTALLIQRAAG